MAALLKHKIEECGRGSWRIIYLYIVLNIFIGLFALYLNVYFLSVNIEAYVNSIQEISAYLDMIGNIQRKTLVVYVYSMSWITYGISLLLIILFFKMNITKEIISNTYSDIPRRFKSISYYLMWPMLIGIGFLFVTFDLAYNDDYHFSGRTIMLANRVAYLDIYLFKPTLLLAMNLFFFSGLVVCVYKIKTINKR